MHHTWTQTGWRSFLGGSTRTRNGNVDTDREDGCTVVIDRPWERLREGVGTWQSPECRRGGRGSVEMVVKDVASGKALVFPKGLARSIPGLWVSPVGVVKRKEGKVREIQGLTIEREVGEGKSVNATTAFDEIPECTLAAVIKRLIGRFLALRQKYPKEHLVFQKMDLKAAFRQVPTDPGEAQAFAYVWDEFVRGRELRLKFG